MQAEACPLPASEGNSLAALEKPSEPSYVPRGGEVWICLAISSYLGGRGRPRGSRRGFPEVDAKGHRHSS